MVEQLVIGILFIASLAYLTRNGWQSLSNKKKCASGCGSCAASKIDQALNAAQQQLN